MSKASDRAYHAVRTRILDGSLAPGTQVREEDVATACAISRTPVREAIRRLEGEKLIERDRQRSYVRIWSETAMKDVFALRLMVEPYVAERVALLIGPDDIDRLKRTSELYRFAITQTDPDIATIVDQNTTFHQVLLEVTRSEVLEIVLERLVAVPIVPQTLRRYSRAQLEKALTDHNELIAAFEIKDPSWASTIMKNHIYRAQNAFFAT
ncbi:GntR family transcriptional regulator [Novosphingobium sp. P6W]|uniref:GntR family transcriptional regulator n=1 Tax=Novosphingobium sp. P6W TaxID=1609758 RepID=UPI000DE80EBC|nr:GntR family transcriptional regulator [Novosphingobium sp. P6W]AXB80522.1 GntR family transcriptional regulator [Novosphingobium sp. P6W]